jgi:hypothetical protein
MTDHQNSSAVTSDQYDIVDALRDGGRDDEHWFEIGKQAADEIERLRAVPQGAGK